MDEYVTFDLIPTCRRCAVFAQLEELHADKVDGVVQNARSQGFFVEPSRTAGFQVRCDDCRETRMARRAVRRVLVPVVQPAML